MGGAPFPPLLGGEWERGGSFGGCRLSKGVFLSPANTPLQGGVSGRSSLEPLASGEKGAGRGFGTLLPPPSINSPPCRGVSGRSSLNPPCQGGVWEPREGFGGCLLPPRKHPTPQGGGVSGRSSSSCPGKGERGERGGGTNNGYDTILCGRSRGAFNPPFSVPLWTHTQGMRAEGEARVTRPWWGRPLHHPVEGLLHGGRGRRDGREK